MKEIEICIEKLLYIELFLIVILNNPFSATFALKQV